jgi:hypothetical protein
VWSILETFTAAHQLKFELPEAAGRREVKVKIDAPSVIAQLRLFLPLEKGPIEIGRIEIGSIEVR